MSDLDGIRAVESDGPSDRSYSITLPLLCPVRLLKAKANDMTVQLLHQLLNSSKGLRSGLRSVNECFRMCDFMRHNVSQDVGGCRI